MRFSRSFRGFNPFHLRAVLCMPIKTYEIVHGVTVDISKKMMHFCHEYLFLFLQAMQAMAKCCIIRLYCLSKYLFAGGLSWCQGE